MHAAPQRTRPRLRGAWVTVGLNHSGSTETCLHDAACRPPSVLAADSCTTPARHAHNTVAAACMAEAVDGLLSGYGAAARGSSDSGVSARVTVTGAAAAGV